jgi:hypothetical protein
MYANAPPVKQSAVARVLGPDMLYEIRQSSGSAARGKGQVNVEVLLRGAEKLCEVYDVEGAMEKIALLRERHQSLAASVAEYQDLVAHQQSQLAEIDTESARGNNDLAEHDAQEMTPRTLTEADVVAEQTEIRELMARKEALEDRVNGMGKDLEGLLR